MQVVRFREVVSLVARPVRRVAARPIGSVRVATQGLVVPKTGVVGYAAASVRAHRSYRFRVRPFPPPRPMASHPGGNLVRDPHAAGVAWMKNGLFASWNRCRLGSRWLRINSECSRLKTPRRQRAPAVTFWFFVVPSEDRSLKSIMRGK